MNDVIQEGEQRDEDDKAYDGPYVLGGQTYLRGSRDE